MRCLLDTSALIAYLGNEEGAETVARVRNVSSLPFIALSELYYVADSYIAAFAQDTKIPLLTKDEDFSVLKDEIEVVWIHRKK